MQVENKLFYHVHKIGGQSDHCWRVGSTFSIGKDTRNDFIKYYDNATIGVHSTDGKTIPMSAAIRNFSNMPHDLQQKNYATFLQLAGKAIKEMGTYIREVIFEEVRKKEFSQLPSRMNCIWLSEAKDVSYWWPRVHSGNKAIFKVSATGFLHRANPSHLISDSIAHNKLRSFAKKYWMGEGVNNKSEEELLFEGTITVLDEYQDINQFGSSTS